MNKNIIDIIELKGWKSLYLHMSILGIAGILSLFLGEIFKLNLNMSVYLGFLLVELYLIAQRIKYKSSRKIYK